MKIEHIRVDGFGRLTSFDTGPKRLGSLVVVLGPNEAGKSTLFRFLTTALYGFQPASRELSPHVPWGTDEAGGEIEVRLSDGDRAIVSRRLRSSPSGTLSVGDESHELRNRPVRWAEHVPRTVFRQVFAITLAELAGLDEETWASIQDRVLGSMGASDLRSPRDVAEALEREAGEIWRPNRRGNQRLRDLQSEIRKLRSRRNDAVERDREVRALVEERANVAARLKEAREERHRERVVVDRVQELLPLKRQLERIEALRRAGGPRSDLVELPADLVGHREALVSRKEELDRELKALDAGLREPEAAIERFDEEARALLEHRDAISALAARAGGAADDRVRLADLEERHRQLEAQSGAEAERLFDGPLPDAVADSVLAVPVELLRDRVERVRAASGEEAAGSRTRPSDEADRGRVRGGHKQTGDDGRAAGRAARGSGSSGSGAPPVGFGPSLTLVALGAGLLAWGLSGGPTLATALGAAGLAVGVVLTLLSRASAERVAAAPTGDVERSRREVRELLAGIPVRAEYLDPPGAPLVHAVEGLRETIREAREIDSSLAVLRTRFDELRADADDVASRLGRETPDDPVELALVLERQLREAERAADAAEAAERERARVLRARDRLAAERTEVHERLSEIDQRIWQLAAGAAGGRPIDVLQRRLDAHARADRLREELETAHPDLEARVEDIREAEEAGVAWAVEDDDLARRKSRIEELDETVEELRGRGDALERDIEHLRGQETVDSVDSEIDSLKEEAERLTAERDRKWLLARLVREADRRFREEHQPDLLRRASEYLKRLTDGRYDRLIVDEEGDGALFQLMGPALPAPVGLARPISTGTLEQAYLGLRLAIVDHLDHGAERLPLFLDEAFVNWDEERRERGLEVVAEVARSRQVFAFTCHPHMAEHLGRRGACVLRLTR